MDGGASAGVDRPGESVGIKTFLIADVRGYTVFTNQRGDEAAAALAAKFAAIVRQHVEARDGVLVELRGDEGLAVFSSPRQAIRAAVELQTAFVDATLADPSIPLRVGIGLDAGEAVPVEGGYRGGALNLAARLCGQAGAGETLASQEVVHLARKVDGVRYVDRGPVRLKGLDQPVQVTRVVAESDDPAERLAAVLSSAPRAVRRRSRARGVAVVAVVAVIAAVLVTLPLVRHHGQAAPALAANGVQLIDASSGLRTGSVPLPGTPSGIVYGAGAVWVSNARADTVVKIDPETRAVVDTIRTGSDSDPEGIAFGDGAVWVALSGTGQLARINPTAGTVVARLAVGNGPTGVAVAAGYVWVTNYYDDTVVRVDTTTGLLVPHSKVLVGNGPVAVAADASGAWVANSGDATLTKISLAGGGVATITVGNGPSAVAIGPTAVWVTNGLDGTLSRIDLGTAVVTTSPVGQGPTGVTAAGPTVWVGDQAGGSVARVDAATGSGGTTTPMGAQPIGTTLVGGELWVAAAAPPSAHRGGTVRFASQSAPGSVDPALAYDDPAWQVLTLTNDGLVGFARVGGPQGGALVADLAASVPTPSPDGRTYSFQLRPGVRYSNGAPVEPEDFRRGIERVLINNSIDSLPGSYYASIVGATACGRALARHSLASCDLSRGIAVNDATRTVTFHLTGADPDFLDRLALTFADAVPASTPLSAVTKPLPATGPYEASYTSRPSGTGPGARPATIVSVDLVRNRYFKQWSQVAQPAGYPDRIVGTYGLPPEREISLIRAGQLDATDDPPPAGLLNQLDTLYPDQITNVVGSGTFGFAMNVNKPPFNDIRVRQALNDAVDRGRLVALSGGRQLTRVNCQILPPDFPGYRPYCPYTRHPNVAGTWSGPDLARARRLVAESGTAGERVTVVMPTDIGFPTSTASYVSGVLTRLGYVANVKVVGSSTYFGDIQNQAKSAKVQISFWGWYSDYLAPSNILLPLFGCGRSSESENTSHFCDPSIQRQMAAALAAKSTRPAQSNQEWAGVDRAVVRQAPWLSLPTRLRAYFVSARTQNVQVSPQWGLLLSQLWTH